MLGQSSVSSRDLQYLAPNGRVISSAWSRVCSARSDQYCASSTLRCTSPPNSPPHAATHPQVYFDQGLRYGSAAAFLMIAASASEKIEALWRYWGEVVAGGLLSAWRAKAIRQGQFIKAG
jgi:hypothetical protein